MKVALTISTHYYTIRLYKKLPLEDKSNENFKVHVYLRVGNRAWRNKCTRVRKIKKKLTLMTVTGIVSRTAFGFFLRVVELF